MSDQHPAVVRNICWTLPNPTVEPEEFKTQLAAKFEDKCRYCIWQGEIAPTTGLPHWQGYMEFKAPMRWNTVQAALGCHFELRRGSQAQAINYCVKEDRTSGPWTYGKPAKQGERTDIAAAVETITRKGEYACLLAHPTEFVKYTKGLQRAKFLHDMAAVTNRDVEVILLYGPAGVGKGHYVDDREEGLQPHEGSTMFRVCRVNNLTYWDNYLDQEAVILDEFCGSKRGDDLSRQRMNQVLDKYPLVVNVKGTSQIAKFTRFYIGTNFHPRTWYNWESSKIFNTFIRRVDRIMYWDMEDDTQQRAPDAVYEKDTEEFNAFLSF